ncbi:Phosphoesterase [Candidatus Magnetobacterium bavaricum]|uniref:Phosphoesterase n=1 Tax=Candidatus Magnetobacterium bavaricum TaxID=29290 RepID=A0A0F3GIX5_9BACT|nr:Phosphoesterase [Candidatus Magnetobacterium bavaricum]
MAYAVISDVHSNLHALEAVLKDIRDRRIDEIYFVGDAVGYGPQPNLCIDLLKRDCDILIAGNHDWAVLEYISTEYFNIHAADAVTYNREVMTDEHMQELEKFNLLKSSGKRNALFVHATPHDPENWDYLFSVKDAEVNFEHFDQKLCFIGHSHTPVIIEQQQPTGEILIHRAKTEINDTSRYIINDGSVGQPRDGDPRASYAIIDDASIEIVRVQYDISKTQKEMEAAKLPFRLIERLAYGY